MTMKNVADIYALSPMQRLMLFHARAAQGADDVLFNQIVYDIAGPLDVDAYRRAWQLMVNRHDALRTIFVWQDGKEPLQVVREQAELPWVEHDWRALPAPEQEGALVDLLASDRAQGFDPLRAPLTRLHLVRQADAVFKLVWSSHHLIIDRWCIGILFDEVQRAYAADLAGQVPDLKPAPRYRDYIAWLAGQEPDSAEAYWRATLRDLRARPLTQRQAATGAAADLAVFRLALSGEEWARVRQFGLDHNLTPGALVAGAWALVLAAATGVNDALFGLTVSGRPADLPEVGRTVGCFINNVPLRAALPGDLPVAAWLQGLQDQQLELQAYEYVSLAQVEGWSSARSRGPLFDTLLVLQAPVQLAAPEGLAFTYAGGGMQTGYPISLGAVPDRDELRLTFTFEPEVVSGDLIVQLAGAVGAALRAMPDSGDRHLHALLEQVAGAAPHVEPAPTVSVTHVDQQPYVPSRTLTEAKLAQVWAEVLGVPRVGITERFSELGGDSIRSLLLFTAVEQQLGVSLPISLLFSDPTVAQMAEAIGQVEGDGADPVLVPINLAGKRPPVFFTHGVQGGLIWLKHVAPLLDPDQPAYGLQAVGLQAEMEPDRSMEAMATRYVEAMRRVQPTGPYYLAGFCFGGVLAYEVARQLEEHHGERTAMLAVIDGYPPRAFHRQRSLTDPLRLRIIRQNAPYWLNGYEAFGGWRLRERVLERRGTNWEQALVEEDPDGAAPDNLSDLVAATGERQRQLTRINEQAGDAYMPQPYGGEVTLLRAELLGVRHAFLGPVDPYRGWDTLAAGGVTIRPVAGSHVGMLSPPFVASLADQLNEALRSAMPAVV